MTKDDAWTLVDMIQNYFADRSDVNDGDYGEQELNKEMRFASACEELLAWIEKQP